MPLKPYSWICDIQKNIKAFGITETLAGVLTAAGLSAATASTVATAAVTSAALGAAGGAITGGISGGPLGALTGGLEGGGLGAVTGGIGGYASPVVGAALDVGNIGGGIITGAGLGAATNAATGGNPLEGAVTGGISGGLSQAASTTGTNATSSATGSGAAGAPDLGNVDLTAPSPDVTYAGTAPTTTVPDAGVVANFLNPGGSTPVTDLSGAGGLGSAAGAAQGSSSVLGNIAKLGAPVASAAAPTLLSALGLSGSSSTGSAPVVGGSPASLSTPSATQVTLTPTAPGAALGAPKKVQNSAQSAYNAPAYGGGQSGYSSGSGLDLQQVLTDLGI